MAERQLIQPPEIVETDGPIIFLAGPIQGAPDWQAEAISIIHDIDASVTVASPRKDYPEGTFIYENQVDWETTLLRRAGEVGVVGFWLAAQSQEKLKFADRLKASMSLLFRGSLPLPRSFAQTSRFEIGEWKMHHEYEGTKLTIGIEEGFGNARYIRRRFEQDCPDVQIADTLEEMCLNAVQLVRQ